MQQYGMSSFVMGLITAGIALFVWSPPQDGVVRMAYLEAVKPVEEAVLREEAEPESSIELETLSGAAVAQFAPSTTDNVAIAIDELPAQFASQFEASSETTSKTRLGDISFARDVSEEYAPINSSRVFPAGSYRLYATFDYEAMADGMEWAWVWWHNGVLVDGGAQEWVYGEGGPGYVYFEPQDGFSPGDYVLQIWVNEEKMTEANIVVTAAATQ